MNEYFKHKPSAFARGKVRTCI